MNQVDMKMIGPPPKSWNMFRAMGGVGILCSLLIVFTYQATLSTILKNKAEYLEKVIYKVLPDAQTKRTFVMSENESFDLLEDEEHEGRKVYAGYNSEGDLIGLVLEAHGQGFQDAIHIIYGYSPERQAVVGIQVLESKETPGLGDKIEKDPDFLKNFEALDVSLTGDGTTIQNPIVTVKKGSKESPWQIDGITGATISSKAIGNILRESTAEMIPLLVKELDGFRLKQASE